MPEMMPPPRAERIVLLQLKRIGDFILTAPAVAALRAARPEAEIVTVVPENVAGLAACMPGVDRVLPHRRKRANFDVWASLCVGEWDACLDFAGTDRTALMTWLSGAARRIGYDKFAGNALRRRAYTDLCPASVRGQHTVDYHLALVRGLAPGAEAPAGPALRIDPVAQAQMDARLDEAGLQAGRLAVVHIGTAREEKFWPPPRWAEVVQALIEARGFQVVLTGTNAGLERPHLDALRAALRVPVVDWTGRLSLIELAALLSRSALALGVDSMAMHLAALFKRPQVVLFGPTNPFHWRPRHPQAVVVQADKSLSLNDFKPRSPGVPMNETSTRAVLDAIESVRSPGGPVTG